MPSAKQSAAEIVRALQGAGFEAYFAGGCVRDMLLGREPKDYDIATSARPKHIESKLERTKPIGKAFGVIQVQLDRHTFEVATFRTDHDYRDGRRPSSVTFSSAREDALRRDFTINSMFYDPVSGAYLDYAGGMPDIGAKLIRAVGNPDTRFKEDHLRMLRAVRFSQCLDFRIEKHTSQSVKRNAPLIKRISVERVEGELLRILTEAPRPGTAVMMLDRLNIFRHILPVTHRSHSPSQFRKMARSLDSLAGGSPELLLTALFLRTGATKGTMGVQNSVETLRKRTATELGALRVPKSMTRSVLAAQSLYWRIRRKRKHFPRQLLPDLVTDAADIAIRLLSTSLPERALDLSKLRESAKRRLRTPAVTGGDLMKAGVKPGPKMAELLAEALVLQCDGMKRKAILDRITRS